MAAGVISNPSAGCHGSLKLQSVEPHRSPQSSPVCCWVQIAAGKPSIKSKRTMPSTNKARRDAYAKRKLEEAADGEILKKKQPPPSSLRKPLKKSKLGTKEDHGGHQAALNFPQLPNGVVEVQMGVDDELGSMNDNGESRTTETIKIGDKSLGFVYDSDCKSVSKYAGNGERTHCKESEKYMAFLNQVHAMLVKRRDIPQTLKPLIPASLRVNILCGARTHYHTDSYRGNTPNLLFIVDNQPQVSINSRGKVEKTARGWLTYEKFPSFKTSVVIIEGKHYIPHNYSEVQDECRCIGEDPEKPGRPKYFCFRTGVIDAMRPYADLPFGVVGWVKTARNKKKKNGVLQVIRNDAGHKLYKKPLTFEELTWKEVLEEAGKHLNPKIPKKRSVRLDKVDQWMSFDAYKYRHAWSGEHLLVRYHAYFRTVREVPTASNLVHKGGKTNYVDCRNAKGWENPKGWKVYNAKTEKWEFSKI